MCLLLGLLLCACVCSQPPGPEFLSHRSCGLYWSRISISGKSIGWTQQAAGHGRYVQAAGILQLVTTLLTTATAACLTVVDLVAAAGRMCAVCTCLAPSHACTCFAPSHPCTLNSAVSEPPSPLSCWCIWSLQPRQDKLQIVLGCGWWRQLAGGGAWSRSLAVCQHHQHFHKGVGLPV